jgi:hypothetical protein
MRSQWLAWFERSVAFGTWKSATDSNRRRAFQGWKGVHPILANPPWRQLLERTEKIRGDKKHVEAMVSQGHGVTQFNTAHKLPSSGPLSPRTRYRTECRRRPGNGQTLNGLVPTEKVNCLSRFSCLHTFSKSRSSSVTEERKLALLLPKRFWPRGSSLTWIRKTEHGEGFFRPHLTLLGTPKSTVYNKNMRFCWGFEKYP